MVISLSDQDVRRLRLELQHLSPYAVDARQSSVADIVRDVCGIQAQEIAAAALGVRVRSIGLVEADFNQARTLGRAIVRTWAQRGTLHLVATEDLRWLLPLYGPIFNAGNRTRRAELGLNEEKCRAASNALQHILADGGALTRAEIVECLARKKIVLEGQAVPHLLEYCALNGLVCMGAERDGEPTYVLLQDWIDGWKTNATPLDSLYAELVVRFLRAYGPAQPEDMAMWSGLPLRQIREGWKRSQAQMIEVAIGDQSAWMLQEQTRRINENTAKTDNVRLLPRYDTYILGYKNRSLMLPEQYARRVNAGGGIIHPTVIVNGRIVGTWKSHKQKSTMTVNIEPFEGTFAGWLPTLEAEVADIGRFLGVAATLHI